jgi:hypothetical protein
MWNKVRCLYCFCL